MLLSRDMAAAFGDWLERERIQQALLRARPDLSGRLDPDEDRPMLRVPLGDGTSALVAKISGPERPTWVVGIPHPRTPILREAATLEELVQRVLEVLGPLGVDGAPAAGRPPGGSPPAG